jgi:hypothetical protein
MKQDRFLTAILIGVAVLVVAALALFFIRGTDQPYLEENEPGGVVLNYVLALQSGDYEKAYSYLAEAYKDEPGPTFAEFRSYFLYDYNRFGNVSVSILSVDREADMVWVEVETIESGGGLFGGVYRYPDSAILILDNAGEWKLIRMPYQFWGWEWFGDAVINR